MWTKFISNKCYGISFRRLNYKDVLQLHETIFSHSISKPGFCSTNLKIPIKSEPEYYLSIL